MCGDGGWEEEGQREREREKERADYGKLTSVLISLANFVNGSQATLKAPRGIQRERQSPPTSKTPPNNSKNSNNSLIPRLQSDSRTFSRRLPDLNPSHQRSPRWPHLLPRPSASLHKSNITMMVDQGMYQKVASMEILEWSMEVWECTIHQRRCKFIQMAKVHIPQERLNLRFHGTMRLPSHTLPSIPTPSSPITPSPPHYNMPCPLTTTLLVTRPSTPPTWHTTTHPTLPHCTTITTTSRHLATTNHTPMQCVLQEQARQNCREISILLRLDSHHNRFSVMLLELPMPRPHFTTTCILIPRYLHLTWQLPPINFLLLPIPMAPPTCHTHTREIPFVDMQWMSMSQNLMITCKSHPFLFPFRKSFQEEHQDKCRVSRMCLRLID